MNEGGGPVVQLGSCDGETEASRMSELAASGAIAEGAISMTVNDGAARPAEPAPAFIGWCGIAGAIPPFFT